MTARPRARVATSASFENLAVIPIPPTGRLELAAALRSEGIPVSLEPGCVSVPALRSPALLTNQAVDLDWSDDAKKFAQNRESTLSHHASARETLAKFKEGGALAARPFIEDIDEIEILDGHQVVNVAAMCIPGSPGLCVFDEQGAGKTVTFIFAFDLLAKRNTADVALVIAPKSMVPEWPRDLKRFKGDLYKVQVLAGARKAKMESLRTHPDFIVTNFETAVSMEAELTAMLRAYSGRVVLAVDESFFVKNLHAKRTQAIRRLREWCGRAFVLCGTPAPNAPEDLVQQFSLVDFGVTFSGIRIPEDKDESVHVVGEAIEQRGLFVRHLKQDVLPDLPGKSFERVLLPLSGSQARLYQGACRDLILDLESTSDEDFHKRLASFLARRMALLQICSHPGMVSPNYDETPCKLAALDELLAELIGRRGEKVIIWSYFRYSVEQICQRFAKFGAVRYDGSVESIDERREAVRRFQEDDHTMLFVANPAAAGAGLTLHRARTAIYESMSNQAAHYLQSLDRIHRRGQKREVEYLILLADETVELPEYERLLAKEQSARHLLGDKWQEAPSREGMLHELLTTIGHGEQGGGDGTANTNSRGPEGNS